MKDPKLTAALEVLMEQLEAQVREVAETKRTINGLCRRMGEEAKFPDDEERIGGAAIKNDAYYGKPLATAVSLYLERVKQATSAEDILRALEQGGFDFRALDWGENDRVRILAISLAKNNVTFHKLPNNTFGLRNWYDDAILKRAEKKASAPRKTVKRKAVPTKKRMAQIEAHKETPSTGSTVKGADSKPKPGIGQGSRTPEAATLTEA
jgi:hypothetical protein